MIILTKAKNFLLVVAGFITNDNSFEDIPPLNSLLLAKFDQQTSVHRTNNRNLQPPDFLMVGFIQKLLYAR